MEIRTLLTLTVPLVPRGQRRAKPGLCGRHARMYKDARQEAEERTLTAFLAPHQPDRPFEGQLLLGAKAYLPLPKSRPKSWKAAALEGSIRPVCKPDMDNLLKHLKDCLTLQRFWADDRLVIGYLPGTGKYYSDRPRWEIEIAELLPGAGRPERENARQGGRP